MINSDTLIDVAQRRGYRIRWHRGGPKAAWIPRRNTITLRLGMDDATTLCSLAHELGHAHYGDPHGHHCDIDIRAERFAARLVINSTDYATTEAIYGPHPNVLAHELGVTVKVLKTWQTLHERQVA